MTKYNDNGCSRSGQLSSGWVAVRRNNLQKPLLSRWRASISSRRIKSRSPHPITSGELAPRPDKSAPSFGRTKSWLQSFLPSILTTTRPCNRIRNGMITSLCAKWAHRVSLMREMVVVITIKMLRLIARSSQMLSPNSYIQISRENFVPKTFTVSFLRAVRNSYCRCHRLVFIQVKGVSKLWSAPSYSNRTGATFASYWRKANRISVKA